MKQLLATLLSLLAFVAPAAESAPSVGLVLSGGGAKGIAHIGVIQALEDNDIPIDYITGTSMGAIVGGLYASGYTPQEMLELLGSKGFSDWSTGVINEKLVYYFSQPQKSPALFSLNLGERDSTKSVASLPTSLINPLPMNFAFMELFSSFTAQCGGNFDNLFVPFRCVTSDVYAKRKVILKSGSLGDAIRMSMSFPVVFQPIEMNGVPMYDGGIYDNYPVDVMMTEFSPGAVIGVDVSSHTKPQTNNMLDQLECMIMQPNDYPFPKDKGISIHIDLEEFGLLDFPKFREIYEIGYRHAMEKIDSIKALVPTRIPALTRQVRRAVFKSSTPEVIFDSVTVGGGTPAQNEYLRSLFPSVRANRADTFGLAAAKTAYYRAITPGKLLNFVPNAVYNPVDSMFRLDLRATVKDRFRVGMGGYVSSSTNSMLFLSGGYSTLSYHSLSTGLKLWIGQSYLAAFADAEVMLPTYVPSSVGIEFEVSQQKFHEAEKLFFEVNSPNFVSKSELFTRLYFRMAAGQRGKAGIYVGYGHLTDRFYPRDVSLVNSGRDHGIFNLGQVAARWEYSTLDNAFYPTAGAGYTVVVEGNGGRYSYRSAAGNGLAEFSEHPIWAQGFASAVNYYGIGRHFSLGTEFSALISSRKLLRDYYASIVAAPAFYPSPSSYNAFNPAFRANSYVTAGIKPVWKISSTLQLRGNFHGFLPVRRIEPGEAGELPHYGDWFSNPEFFGEISGVVSLPFAAVSVYGNYMSSPARNWNFGLSIGFFMLAPKFLE